MSKDKSSKTKETRGTNEPIIAIARLKKIVGDEGVNHAIEAEISKINSKLRHIEKQGGPKEPSRLSKKAAKSKDNRKKYDEDREKYKSYRSDQYKEVQNAFGFFRLLNKMQPLSDSKKELTEKQTATKNAIMEKLKSPEYKKLMKGTDLKSPDTIGKRIDQLTKEYGKKGLDLFIKKEQLSRQKIRFNPLANITLSMLADWVSEQLLSRAMDNALAPSETSKQRKIIQPEFFLPGIEDLPAWPLIQSLRTTVALRERESRRQEYNRTKKDRLKDLKKQASSSKKKSSKTSRIPTFEEEEVKNEFAIHVKQKVKSKEGNDGEKEVVKWEGIDYLDPSNPENISTVGKYSVNIGHYIKKQGETIIEKKARGKGKKKREYKKVRVSSHIKSVISDIIVELVQNLTPVIMESISNMKVKTIDHNIIMSAIRIRLSNWYGYQTESGSFKFTSDHQALFDKIDEHIKEVQKNAAKSKNSKKSSKGGKKASKKQEENDDSSSESDESSSSSDDSSDSGSDSSEESPRKAKGGKK